jgi:hypothetical protein
MEFIYDAELQTYMREKNKRNIIVEVATSDSSDFEVTELHVHFVNEKQSEFFKNKKHFRSIATELGEVLLPPYRLEYEPVITFHLKKFLFIPYVAQEGISL